MVVPHVPPHTERVEEYIASVRVSSTTAVSTTAGMTTASTSMSIITYGLLAGTGSIPATTKAVASPYDERTQNPGAVSAANVSTNQPMTQLVHTATTTKLDRRSYHDFVRSTISSTSRTAVTAIMLAELGLACISL